MKSLTELEKKNPIGKIVSEGLSPASLLQKLQEKELVTEDLDLTERGMEYIQYQMSQLDAVQRTMFELFILRHHNVEPNISYEE